MTVNPGCQRQLLTGLRRRRSRTTVLHIVELLALAKDGPRARRRPWRRRRAGAQDEPGPLVAHLNDRPAPDDPGASGAGSA